MNDATNTEVLEEIGRRLRRERINQELTQAMVAERAGLRQATVSRVERGQDFTFETLVAILRALGRIDALDAFLPDPTPSPIELAKRQGRERQRVRPRRVEPDATWVWGDEA